MPRYSYFVRISSPWADVQRVVLAWSLRVDTIVCYEHDENPSNIHCHIALTGADVAKKQLRNIAMAQDVNVKGNENCSFKELDSSQKPYVYMTKGVHLPKYLKGYDSSEAETWMKEWKAPKDNKKIDDWDMLWLTMLTDFEFHTAGGGDDLYKEWMMPPDNKINFYIVRENVKAYVLHKRGGFHKPQNYNIYKCLMRGIIYHWSITVPKGENSFW